MKNKKDGYINVDDFAETFIKNYGKNVKDFEESCKDLKRPVPIQRRFMPMR